MTPPSSTRPHVSIFLPILQGGGAERMMCNLAGGLVDLGFTVDLVVARRGGVFDEMVDRRVRLVSLDAPRTVLAVWRLRRYLRQHRPLALLSTPVIANTVAILAHVLAGRSGRLVVREANRIDRKQRNESARNVRLCYSLLPWSYRLADRVVAVSQAVRHDLLHLASLSPGRVAYARNPSIRSDLDDLLQDDFAHPWLAQPGVSVLLAAGRMRVQKGFDVLLQALVIARRSRDVRLILCGEGKQMPTLKQLAARLGLTEVVDFIGFVSNPFPAMAAVDCFVLSSRWEGSPNVLVEALACGCPVVATDCPSGPREIIGNAPDVGSLVPVDDAPAMAQAILGRLQVPRDSEACRVQVAPYRLAAAARAYAELLLPGRRWAE